MLAGTLNEQMVGSAPRFTLTDKVEGKTRCLYVPAAEETERQAGQEAWEDAAGAQSLLDLAEGQWGKMVHGVRAKKQCVVGGVRWAKGVPFGECRTSVVEIHQMVASDESGAYYGQFMTDLEVNDARRTLEIGTWGRHRWLIETSFKT